MLPLVKLAKDEAAPNAEVTKVPLITVLTVWFWVMYETSWIIGRKKWLFGNWLDDELEFVMEIIDM